MGREFARQDTDVILHYSHHQDGANTGAEEIKAMGRRTSVFQADFDDLDQHLPSLRVPSKPSVPSAVLSMTPTLLSIVHFRRWSPSISTSFSISTSGAIHYFVKDRCERVETRWWHDLQSVVHSRTRGRTAAFGIRRYQGRHHRFHPVPLGWNSRTAASG